MQFKTFQSKKNFNFWKFCFLVKNAFRALRKHFYNPRAHFFKLKFVKFSKSWKWFRNCFKSCPAVNVLLTTERSRMKCLIWKTIFINFKNFHLEQWNKSCPAVNVVAQQSNFESLENDFGIVLKVAQSILQCSSKHFDQKTISTFKNFFFSQKCFSCT